MPVFFLSTRSGAPSPAFDVTTGPVRAQPAAATSPTTWIPPGRIVGDEVAAPAPPTTRPSASTTSTSRPAAAVTTTVTAATEATRPATTAPVEATTTAAPAPATSTTAAPPLTVTLPAALTPIVPAQRPAARHTQRGQASWFDTAHGTCAHRTAPFGTVITVTRHYNGAVTQCVVDDWGPADTTRIIDLSTDTFEKLADAEAGLIEVTIEW